MAIAQDKPVPARREIARRAKGDFKLFIKESWKVLEPATSLLWNWHIDAIAEHLTAVLSGEITRLVVNIAPGHMKSTLFSVMWPAWSWTSNPSLRWLCASHSLGLAIRDNRNCRSLIESDWYQSCYSDAFSLASDQNAKSFFENNARGYRLAVSVGSKGIGKRGTHLLIDDPNDAKASEADIENTLYWFGQTWLSRLNDQEHGSMVVTGQRLGERDLSGYILNNLQGWEHLNLPTEYESARKCHTNIKWDEKSTWKGSDPRTQEDELLWPAKFPEKVLKALKAGLGPQGYAAQHQQSPTPATGGIFDQQNERVFTENHDTYFLHTPKGMKAVKKAECDIFMAADPAISEKQTADYMVIGTWAKTPFRDLLLLNVRRGHWGHAEQQDEIEEEFRESEAEYVAVEVVAYQAALFQDLLVKGIMCKPFTPKTDKVARASGASIWHRNGKMYFPKVAHWLEAYRKELYKFPKAPKDDQVDMTSLAGIAVRSRGPLSEDSDDEEIPEAVEETGGLIPLTVPLKATEEDQAAALQVVLAAKPIDPFQWASEHGFGGGW